VLLETRRACQKPTLEGNSYRVTRRMPYFVADPPLLPTRIPSPSLESPPLALSSSFLSLEKTTSRHACCVVVVIAIWRSVQTALRMSMAVVVHMHEKLQNTKLQNTKAWNKASFFFFSSFSLSLRLFHSRLPTSKQFGNKLTEAATENISFFQWTWEQETLTFFLLIKEVPFRSFARTDDLYLIPILIAPAGIPPPLQQRQQRTRPSRTQILQASHSEHLDLVLSIAV
jgi:hypothetical protein